MTKSIYALSFALLLLTGCTNPLGEPDFLQQRPEKLVKNDVDLETSKTLARQGWDSLIKYMYSAEPDIDDFIQAQESFNGCWELNSKDYNVYWGWGVIRGLQATMTDEQPLRQDYLSQSVKFLFMVPKYGCPASELGNLDVDIANAYNQLGKFYLLIGELENATVALERAKALLKKQEPTNLQVGRILYLLAVNHFYLNEVEDAIQYAEKAHEENYPVPEDFQKELGISWEALDDAVDIDEQTPEAADLDTLPDCESGVCPAPSSAVDANDETAAAPDTAVSSDCESGVCPAPSSAVDANDETAATPDTDVSAADEPGVCICPDPSTTVDANDETAAAPDTDVSAADEPGVCICPAPSIAVD